MYKTLIQRIASLTIGLALLIGNYTPTQAASNIYYVSTTGSDTNPGTSSSPFKTFAKAISLLLPGDQVLAFGGTYAEQINITKSGTATAPIILKPVSGQQVIIDGEMVRSKAIYVTGSYVTLENFDVRRGLDSCVDLKSDFSIVRNFKVHDCQRTGMLIRGKNILVESSTFYDNVLENTGGINTTGGWSQALHLEIGGESVTLRNNVVYNNWGEGIGVSEGKYVNIYNNLVHDNYSVNIYIDNSMDVNVENNFAYSTDPKYFRSGLPANCISMAEEYVSGWGAQLARIRIVNNIAAFCKRGIGYTYAEVTDGGLDTVLIAFNTIWGSADTGIFVLNQTTKTRNSVIANNIVQQPSGNVAEIQPSTGIYLHHNFWVSPVYSLNNASGPGDLTGDVKLAGFPGVTPESYLLGSSSPAISAAAPLDVQTDYAGNVRGPSYDMGAFQFPGSAAPSLTPVTTATVAPSITPTTAFTSVPTPTPISTSTPVPASVTPQSTFDDNNSAFVYSAGWQNQSATQAYGSSYKETTQNGSSVTFPFTGQSFSILYKGGATYGKFDVYLDGNLVATLNEKVSTTTYQKRWDYSGSLPAGNHTLKLVFKVVNSRINNGSLDAVIVR
jgi:hypothetical protein